MLERNRTFEQGDFEIVTAAIFVKPEVLSRTPVQKDPTNPPKVKTKPPIVTEPQKETNDSDQKTEPAETSQIDPTEAEDIHNKETDNDKMEYNRTSVVTETLQKEVTEAAAVGGEKKPKTVKLEVTLIMYYSTPGILLIGVLCQVIIAYLNRELLFAYVTQLWYSAANLMIIGAAIFAIVSNVTESTCKLSWFLSMVAIGCLSFANFLMTLYKFILIRFPVGKLEMTTVKKQLMWCLASFAFVVVVSSPMLWFKEMLEHLVTTRNFCNFNGGEYTYFIIAWISVVLVLPLLLNLSMFFLIGLKVVEHKKKQEARKSRFLPLTQVSTFSTVGTEQDNDDVNLLRSTGNKAIVQGGFSDDGAMVKTPQFPAIIIVTMAITIAACLPFIPALVNPSWFYSKNKILLDIMYGIMLLSIALSPFVHLWFSKKTKETLMKMGKQFRNFFKDLKCF